MNCVQQVSKICTKDMRTIYHTAYFYMNSCWAMHRIKDSWTSRIRHFSKREILQETKIELNNLCWNCNKYKIFNKYAQTWNIKPSLKISVSNINEQASSRNSITVFVFRIKLCLLDKYTLWLQVKSSLAEVSKVSKMSFCHFL